MRKTFIAVVGAAALGGLTLYSQLAQPEEGSETQTLDTPRFALDSTPIDRSNTHQFTSYAPMLEQVTPTVVTVSSSSVVSRSPYQRNPMEEYLRRYYGIPIPEGERRGGQGPQEEEQQLVPNGMGSGVIISPDGYILTNNHVVTNNRGEAADDIQITLPDKRTFDAELVGRDPQTDVALLRIDAEGLPFLPMADSENLRVGDIVFAVGNPMGLSQTVTMGIVSATGRSRLGILGERSYEDFIQTDASINPGNSGGALVDAAGRLVGINTAIYSRTGGNIGIGFAIPVSLADSVINNLIETGTVQRGYLGVEIGDLDPALAESFGLAGTGGVIINGVQEGSPAEEAGLKRGDVITAVNGNKIDGMGELRIQIARMKPGTETSLTILRDEEEETVKVTLGNLEEGVSGGTGNLIPGVTLSPITPELQRSYGIENDDGLLITDVQATSPLANQLVEGMIILEINDQPVSSLKDARQLLRPGTVNRLWVEYRGNNGYIGIRLPKK